MASPSRETRRSVQTKVLIPVLAFLVLVPAIMVWIVNKKVTGQVQTEARQELSTVDTFFRQQIDGRLNDLRERATNATGTAEYKSIASIVENTAVDPARVDNTFKDFASDHLATFGDECEVILFRYPQMRSVVGGVKAGASFTLADFARAVDAMSGQEQRAGQAKTIGLVGAAFYVASVPLKTANDTQVGSVTVGVRIADAEMQSLARLTHSEIVLASGSQVIVSTLAPFDAALLSQLSVSSRPPGGATQAQPVTVNGDHYLAISGALDQGGRQLGFRYVVLSSLEPSLKVLEDTWWTLVGVGVVGILVSAVVVWFFVRRFIHPLIELRDSAEAVGRGDFSRRIAIISNDECGDLAEAFNRMTTNLQTSRAELEKAVDTIKNTQAQLIQSEKLSAVGQFVAGVAHELNNPLTAVIGFSDLLSQTGTDPATKPHLDVIAKSAHRCHKIVQNLLSFARQHPPERTLIQVNGTIEEVLEIMAYDLRTSNIKVVRKFQDDLPTILADPYQLQQVFVNIIGNARQAIQAFRPDGEITITTRAEGSSVYLELSDNGPGIRPENLSRIFDPFFTTKAVGKGTGLGLSLTYGIIQEHGGKISAQSVLGRGATFIIELPIASEGGRLRREVATGTPRLAPISAPSGKSVLVVDDEEWILALTRQLLIRSGHTVETVLGAEQAVDALRLKKFDVIVCDWKMPGMSGIQFYEHLLATDKEMASRVLYMSGDVINDAFQDFLNRHNKVCLEKPFAIEDFQAAVSKALSGQRTA